MPAEVAETSRDAARDAATAKAAAPQLQRLARGRPEVLTGSQVFFLGSELRFSKSISGKGAGGGGGVSGDGMEWVGPCTKARGSNPVAKQEQRSFFFFLGGGPNPKKDTQMGGQSQIA